MEKQEQIELLLTVKTFLADTFKGIDDKLTALTTNLEKYTDELFVRMANAEKELVKVTERQVGVIRCNAQREGCHKVIRADLEIERTMLEEKIKETNAYAEKLVEELREEREKATEATKVYIMEQHNKDDDKIWAGKFRKFSAWIIATILTSFVVGLTSFLLYIFKTH